MARTIMITKPPQAFDLSDLDRFGVPLYLFGPGELDPFDPGAFFSRVSVALRGVRFNPAEDFIVLTGQVILLSLFMGLLGTLQEPLKLLIFNARHEEYIEREFDLYREVANEY